MTTDHDMVHIQTDRGLWRQDACGYVMERTQAGIWTREKATQIIWSLGPEKHARLIPVEDKSVQFLQDLGILRSLVYQDSMYPVGSIGHDRYEALQRLLERLEAPAATTPPGGPA